MPTLLNGPRTWELSRDDDGHREYKITFRVLMDSPLQGPATALQAPGLPVFGTYWIIDDESDLWAWCRWSADVKPVWENEPNLYFDCTFTFSTKPPDEKDRACKETEVEDPLLEPPKINGSFVVYQEEATHDRFGSALVNSAFERLRGPQVEFDGNRPQVKIDMNVAILDLALLATLANSVNAMPLWGMPPRCVKLSEIEWERKYYGQCYVYYTIHLTFDMRYDTFDRDLLDEATKVLNGQWNVQTGGWDLVNIDGEKPDNTNPQHFIKFIDRLGNPMKGILNGAGIPAGVPRTGTSSVTVYYMCGANGALSSTGDKPPGDILPGLPSWYTFNFNVILPETVWSNAEVYRPGMVVTLPNLIPLPGAQNGYLCLVEVGPTLDQPDLDPEHWMKLPVDDFGNYHVADKGFWNAKTTYDAGDFVSLSESTRIGSLHVEKYPESDFLVLGIPLLF